MSLESVIETYREVWLDQKKVFDNTTEEIPYFSPELIKSDELTSEEKRDLKRLVGRPRKKIFFGMWEVLKNKYIGDWEKQIDYREAINKLGFDFQESVLKEKMMDMSSFKLVVPPWNEVEIREEELQLLYEKGFLPHIYYEKDRPLFSKRMWFIVHFVLRELSEESGLLAIDENVKNNSPRWHKTGLYLHLISFMNNSWNLGETILDYSDNFSRNSGFSGEEFRAHSAAIKDRLWVTEGAVIARKLVNVFGEIFSDPDYLLGYYRDVFALRSFAAFPSRILIDIYEAPSQRGRVISTFGNYQKIAVRSLGVHGSVNTYRSEKLSMRYSFLFSSMDWALSMLEGRKPYKVIDVVKKYSRKDIGNKSICRVCGEEFVPKRPTMDVTCGKKACIKKNKYLSKTKNDWENPPLAR